MRIVMAASECTPYSKTGGLADVVGSLPPALAKLGHQVSVFVPRYRQTRLENSVKVIPSITVPFDDRYRFCSVLDGGLRDGVQTYFVDYPPFFDRDGLYGTAIGDYPDNAERFALLCRAVLEATKFLGRPDVLHCHDWQTALIPILLNTLYAEDPVFERVPCVFTIHNLGYQGLFQPEILPLLLLPWDLFTMTKSEFYGKVNFLKGAITSADFLTTVSRRYAQEIQTASMVLDWKACCARVQEQLRGFLTVWTMASGVQKPIPTSPPTTARLTLAVKPSASERCSKSLDCRRRHSCRSWGSCPGLPDRKAST